MVGGGLRGGGQLQEGGGQKASVLCPPPSLPERETLTVLYINCTHTLAYMCTVYSIL